MRVFLRSCLFVVLALGAAEATRAQNGITVTPSSATLLVGQTLQLTSSQPSATWDSNDNTVATVTSTGLVRVVGTGDRQARIYAKYKNTNGWCDITVGTAPPPNQAPTASITSPTGNVTITAGQSVSFAGSGSDSDGTITGYTWSFPGGSPASSTAASPGVVTYAGAGVFTATFRVTDNGGLQSAAATRTITVNATPANQAPTATITSPASNVTITEGQSVSFAGSGSDSDGTVTAYSWTFPGGSPASSAVAGPGAVSYAAAGTYTATFRVTDDDGAQSVAVTRTVTVNAQTPTATPYGGTPAPIPGLIEAEHFDEGGEAVAYHDIDAGNNGGLYRTTDVDIQASTDTGAGYHIGWTRETEWLQYTVVITAGTYDLELRMANTADGARLHLEVDGQAITGPITVPNTGGFQIWQTVTVPGVTLAGGTRSLRVFFDTMSPANTAVGNLNWIRLAAPAPPTCTYQVAPATIPQFPSGGAYTDLTVTTQAGCAWTASSPASWATVAPTSSAGPGTTRLTVVANTAQTTRSTTVTVAGQARAVTQAGAPATASLCDDPFQPTGTIVRGTTARLLTCLVGPVPSGFKVQVSGRFGTGGTGIYEDRVTDLGAVQPAGPANAAGKTPYYLLFSVPVAGTFTVSSVAYNYDPTNGWAQTWSVPPGTPPGSEPPGAIITVTVQ